MRPKTFDDDHCGIELATLQDKKAWAVSHEHWLKRNEMMTRSCRAFLEDGPGGSHIDMDMLVSLMAKFVASCWIFFLHNCFLSVLGAFTGWI